MDWPEFHHALLATIISIILSIITVGGVVVSAYGANTIIDNGSKCPSRVLDHQCTICGGDGKVDKVSYCTHGLRYSHSYCTHNKTGKHDK